MWIQKEKGSVPLRRKSTARWHMGRRPRKHSKMAYGQETQKVQQKREVAKGRLEEPSKC